MSANLDMLLTPGQLAEARRHDTMPRAAREQVLMADNAAQRIRIEALEQRNAVLARRVADLSREQMATAIHRCRTCNSVRRVAYRREMRPVGYGRKEAVYFRESDGARCLSPFIVECCGSATAWNWLKAFLNAAVKCDARCVHAKGFSCECSCGGENHATGGMFTGLLAEAA